MTESRRVRFASIDGLRRSDLSVAGEVWLDEVFRSSWATPEVMKLAMHLVRYMRAPETMMLTISSLERHIQLSVEQVKLALRMLSMYGAIDAYVIEREEVKVALNLTMLQRLRVLEVRHRLELLMRSGGDEPPIRERRWIPTLGAREDASSAA